MGFKGKCEYCGGEINPGVNGLLWTARKGGHYDCMPNPVYRDELGYYWTEVDWRRGYIEVQDPETNEKVRYNAPTNANFKPNGMIV